MRISVLDIGSNTVHLLVVDAHAGARPLPATSHKEVMRLAEHLDAAGCISASGAKQLKAFVQQARRIADDQGSEELLAFATSAIREAPNGGDVLSDIHSETGVALKVLSGPEEAALTFLAVRRWCGWSAGRILNLDIGGGSLELAMGDEESPAAALSVPLGAGRMTREYLSQERPSRDRIDALAQHARITLGRVAGEITRQGRPDNVLASSKTFRSLARLAGAAPSSEGMYVARTLSRTQLEAIIEQIHPLSHREIAGIPGISAARAPQLLAGAIVAHAAMTVLDVQSLTVSPWALREGLILKRMDSIDAQ